MPIDGEDLEPESPDATDAERVDEASSASGDEASADEEAPHAEGPASALDRTPLLIWAAMSALSVLVRTAFSPQPWNLDRWDVLAQWDSTTHLAIADHGYRAGGPFVLPGYPGLVRASTWITGNRVTAAVLVTYAASAAASWLLWSWLEHRGVGKPARIWSVLAMLAYPYGFVLFGVVGPDALCLALVLAAFVLIDRNQPLVAGVVAALAITTQITALAIVPALLVMAWTDRSTEAGDGAVPLWRRWSPVALSMLGPIGVSVYFAVAVDDAAWPWRGDGAFNGLTTGVLRPVTWIRVGWVLGGAPADVTVNRAAQSLLLIACVLAAYWVFKRFGAAMAVFTVGVAVTTLVGFTDTASSGRRLTLAFPAVALVGGALSRLPRPAAAAVLVVSGSVSMLLYALFTRSHGLPYF